MDSETSELIKWISIVALIGAIILLTMYTIDQEYRIQHLESVDTKCEVRN